MLNIVINNIKGDVVMNKKLIAGITFALLVASIGTVTAEPVRDLQNGQTVIGLGLNDYANTGMSYYAEHGLTDKIIVVSNKFA